MARPTLKQMRDVLIERAFTVDVHYLDTDTFDRIEYNIKDVNSDIENNTSFYLDTVNKLKKLDKERVETVCINSATGRIELSIRAKSSNNI